MASSGAIFMNSPLVQWVETFQRENAPALQIMDLYDGVFLNDVLRQIDPRPSYDNVNRDVEDENGRLLNWDILLKNIRAYYMDVLQQLIVTKMPNIQAICREPDKDTTFEEIRKVLLLILGCAIQCEKKEIFIENIKLLAVDVQHAIVEHIKEATDDSETILSIEPPEHLETYVEKMFNHITRLIKERDDFGEVIIDVSQERDYYQAQSEGQSAPVMTVSPEKHHLAVELADQKAKLRRIRQELEDKVEQLSDMREEMQSSKEIVAKLRSENLELVQAARAARTYRDELDVFREKASKVDKYESEITKYKEKLNELDFFKSRVEELREDNAILVETKSMLEEQLTNSHKRVETVIELENELINYRQQIQAMSADRDTDRERIQELTEDIARLEFAKKNSMNESATLEMELEEAKKVLGGKGGTLSDQMKETANTKILRLELENQRLQQKVEEMRENSLIENSTINLELEKENQRLAKKVEKLQGDSSGATQRMLEMEQKQREFTREKEKLTQTLETVKENSERQVKELEQENMHLTQTLQTLRERTEKSNDLRIREVEKENKRLHENVTSMSGQVSKLDFENRQLQKTYQRLKESSDKISGMENVNDSLEKENSILHQEVAMLRLTCEKYGNLEQENSIVDLENQKLYKTIESLQVAVNKKEELEQENITLKVDNQRLQRTQETLRKSSSSTVGELESEKDELNKEVNQLKKLCESQKIEQAKFEQMEIDLLDLDSENQKVQKSLEATTRRVQQLEQDNNDLENENEKFEKTIETLKVSMKRLSEVEKENAELESEVCDLSKDKARTEKENKKLRQSLDMKESALDEVNTKLTNHDRELKVVKKSAERSKDVDSKVKELEKENKDITQKVSIEKKIVATLREDLVNEKLKTQQLKNELEKLTQELEHIGINRDKLSIAQTSHTDSRYQALESMMEETLSKNMQMKEDKIHALESRLEESKSRNLKLQEELRMVRRECESLKQRYEEEIPTKSVDTVGYKPTPPPKPGNVTREILQLKDHLVDVERSNATLLSENQNLKSHNDSLNRQLHRLESQSSNSQTQVMNLQDRTSNLQAENVRLQVENTTLQSQSASLVSQNANLQTQLGNLESEHERLINSHEQLQSAHEVLVSDHESLQHLHEQLTVEYEALISEHGSLKSLHKASRNEVKDLREQVNSLLEGKSDVSRIRGSLEKEREQLKMELKSLGNLQMDYNRLRDEHDRMKSNGEKMNRDLKDVLGDLKNTKTEYNNLQLKHTELQGCLADHKDQIHSMDMEVVKLADKCESMAQMNAKLEDENRALMLQVQTLLNQNQDMLTRALESKDHLGETEKAYLEKLADLRRQKEKLEEKIMEQYKMGRWDTSPRKKAGLGTTIVRKAKGLIRAHRSRSRPNLNESPDSSSVGSYGDTAEGMDTSRKSATDSRRKSSGHLADIPKLSAQNKGLAKSTNALNFKPDESSQLRGARSTDDLANHDLSHAYSQRSEKDSLSSNNSAYMNLPGLARPSSLGDDDGGFQAISPSPRESGRTSPGSEMVSLEQFLKETDNSPESRRKTLRDNDGEREHNSRDGGSSECSGSRSHSQPPPQPRRRAPVPPPNQPEGRESLSSPPPVPTVSNHHQNQQDLNLSRMSRISTSSVGSSSEDKPEAYQNNNNNIMLNNSVNLQTSINMQTSTPKQVPSEELRNGYERRRYNRPQSAVSLDPSRRHSSFNPDRVPGPNTSTSDHSNYSSAVHNNATSTRAGPGAADYRTWNGRERSNSPGRSMSPPSSAQQHYTNRASNTSTYSTPNRSASAVPFHGCKTPVDRERQQQQQYPQQGRPSSPGLLKPKCFTPQPGARIVSAADMHRDQSSHPSRPSSAYLQKPSPVYPSTPMQYPMASPRAGNTGESSGSRQLPNTPTSNNSVNSGRVTPSARAQRTFILSMNNSGSSTPERGNYSDMERSTSRGGDQIQYSQPVIRGGSNGRNDLCGHVPPSPSSHSMGHPVPTPRRTPRDGQPDNSGSLNRSSNYGEVSMRGVDHNHSISSAGMSRPDRQQQRTPSQSQTQQPVMLASRLTYPLNGRAGITSTPTARIQPQAKVNNNDQMTTGVKQPTAEEQKNPNSVWGMGHTV